ncbi:MAG: hypothetical protein SGILL_003000 [Bacillariaceae sp.]
MPRRKSPLALQLFLAAVVCSGAVMLLVQMHILHLHLSDFSSSMDRYMDQQKEFFHHLPSTKGKRMPRPLPSDSSDDKQPLGEIPEDEDEDLKPILKILQQAGHDITNDEEIRRESLPKWSKILDAYGPPKILGLETCQAYRDAHLPDERTLAVGGLFNTGTNLLYALLTENCQRNHTEISRTKYSTVQWQVPWGKHIPANRRSDHTHKKPRVVYDAVMPIVTVRDPYTWMQSMCRQSYAAQFDFSKKTCPNIVPYPEDIEAHPRYGKMKHIPVHVKYDKTEGYAVKYESLPSLWNEWYSLYKNATGSFPFVMVRMEDLVFHAETVMPQLCECAGMVYGGKLKHQGEVANQNHGIELNATDQGLLRSIIRYGNITNRRVGYPPFQIDAAKEVLSETSLMGLFRYPYLEQE